MPLRIASPRRARPARPGLERLGGRLLLSVPGTIAIDGAKVTNTGVEQVRFNATFEDTDPGVLAVIDWGDGTHSAAQVSTIDYIPGATGDNHGLFANHTYADGGNYTVTATVLDANGGVGQATTPAAVASPYPASPSEPPERQAGPTLSLYQAVQPFGSDDPDLPTAEVTGLYNAILGRAPDAAGLAAAVAVLKGGGSTQEVASDLLHSAEYDTDLVASSYQTDLGRAGSPSEISGWVSLMQGGMSAPQVAADFLTSAEFNADHPDAASFALALTEDALDRAPSASEISAGVTALESGTSRASAVDVFLDSPEADATAARGFFEAFLGRPIDPPSLQADVAALQAGVPETDLAAAIAGSPGFTALARESVGT